MKPFNRERFLFWLLAAVFLWQASIFTFGVVMCFNGGGLKNCPEIGNRFDATSQTMVATTLALLGAGAVMTKTQQKRPQDSETGPERSSSTIQQRRPK